MTFTAKHKKSSRTICSPRRRGGDGGNRTPVRKRVLRNFSGRRRLFAFPRPCASRHARGFGSFMMHGTLKALRTHGPHSSTPLSGPWASRKRRSRIKRREEQCCRCSLIYKLPVLWMPGASARYSCLRTPVETSTSPRRQKKLASFRFRGLRKCRENCISAPSFFLSKSKGKPLILLWRNDSIGQLAARSATSTTGGSILPFKIGPASLGSDFIKEQRCHILSKTKDKRSFL